MEILTTEFITSIADYCTFRGDNLPQIAVAGKSNSGKSSLINSLCRSRNLAKVSKTPGKTRLINVFLINNSFNLIDLPGYGYAKVDKREILQWGTMVQGYFNRTKSLRCVLILVDIRHEPNSDDVMLINFLRQQGLPYTVIATKADKTSRSNRPALIAVICRILQVQPWEVLCYSSEDGTGRIELLSLLKKTLT